MEQEEELGDVFATSTLLRKTLVPNPQVMKEMRPNFGDSKLHRDFEAWESRLKEYDITQKKNGRLI